MTTIEQSESYEQAPFSSAIGNDEYVERFGKARVPTLGVHTLLFQQTLSFGTVRLDVWVVLPVNWVDSSVTDTVGVWVAIIMFSVLK